MGVLQTMRGSFTDGNGVTSGLNASHQSGWIKYVPLILLAPQTVPAMVPILIR
ncbi:hypothetical protein D3C80_2157230 [compost metagenome]